MRIALSGILVGAFITWALNLVPNINWQALAPAMFIGLIGLFGSLALKYGAKEAWNFGLGSFGALIGSFLVLFVYPMIAIH